MLQKSTLDFLKNLKKNNNREWFEKNKPVYEKAKVDFENFISDLVFNMVKINPRLIDVNPLKCIFRIYKDVRFSKNKEPYKINFGASIGESGKDLNSALFYIHLEPGDNSFIAAGRYMPDSNSLKKIRERIIEDPDTFKKIISDKKLKSFFPGLSDMKVKTTPRGIFKDHPEIELLRYTSYIVEKKIEDKLILANDYKKLCLDSYKVLMPFLNYLNESQK